MEYPPPSISCSPAIRERSWKKIQIEKKKKEYFMSNMKMAEREQILAKWEKIYKINQYDLPLFSIQIVKKQNYSFKNWNRNK